MSQDRQARPGPVCVVAVKIPIALIEGFELISTLDTERETTSLSGVGGSQCNFVAVTATPSIVTTTLKGVYKQP